MNNTMQFSNTFEEFVNDYSFRDSDGVYTNGSELIQTFRVMQGYEHFVKQIREDMITELKSLLRCRNYRGCVAIKGCDGVCRLNSDICKSCENFGIPYSLLVEWQKRGREWIE